MAQWRAPEKLRALLEAMRTGDAAAVEVGARLNRERDLDAAARSGAGYAHAFGMGWAAAEQRAMLDAPSLVKPLTAASYEFSQWRARVAQGVRTLDDEAELYLLEHADAAARLRAWLDDYERELSAIVQSFRPRGRAQRRFFQRALDAEREAGMAGRARRWLASSDAPYAHERAVVLRWKKPCDESIELSTERAAQRLLHDALLASRGWVERPEPPPRRQPLAVGTEWTADLVARAVYGRISPAVLGTPTFVYRQLLALVRGETGVPAAVRLAAYVVDRRMRLVRSLRAAPGGAALEDALAAAPPAVDRKALAALLEPGPLLLDHVMPFDLWRAHGIGRAGGGRAVHDGLCLYMALECMITLGAGSAAVDHLLVSNGVDNECRLRIGAQGGGTMAAWSAVVQATAYADYQKHMILPQVGDPDRSVSSAARRALERIDVAALDALLTPPAPISQPAAGAGLPPAVAEAFARATTDEQRTAVVADLAAAVERTTHPILRRGALRLLRRVVGGSLRALPDYMTVDVEDLTSADAIFARYKAHCAEAAGTWPTAALPDPTPTPAAPFSCT